MARETRGEWRTHRFPSKRAHHLDDGRFFTEKRPRNEPRIGPHWGITEPASRKPSYCRNVPDAPRVSLEKQPSPGLRYPGGCLNSGMPCRKSD